MTKTKEILNNLFLQARDLENGFSAKIVSRIDIRNTPVAYGYNSQKSHSFQKRYGKDEFKIYWHGETNAIYNALRVVDKNDLRKATLYVARAKTLKVGNMDFDVCGIAKPCEGCMKAIDDFKIKRVIYTQDAIDSNSRLCYGVIER